MPNATQTFGIFSNLYPDIKHPSLSLNGFTESTAKGNSLQEILTNLQSYQTQLVSLNNQFGSSFEASYPNNIETVEANAIYLERQAFMALVTFGLEQYNNSNHGFFSYAFIVSLLKENLKKSHSWYVVNREIQGDKEDYVKWTQSMMNYARAIDLYLGLEILVRSHTNASQFTGDLLTDSEKKLLMSNLNHVIAEGYEALYNDDRWYIDASETIGLIDIDMKEIESGNRPLKMFMAIGYCAMAYQSILTDSKTEEIEAQFRGVTTIKNMRDIFIETLNVSDFRHKTNNRAHYYAYQTNNGEENWAEGPYYLEFALREILPFWHAVRVNNTALPDPYTDIDPFNESKFLNPIKWMTDLIMPDGRIPTIDDANFRYFYKLNYLNWHSDYVNGNEPAMTISKRANYWLQESKNSNSIVKTPSDWSMSVYSLAIPRISTAEFETDYPGNYNGPNQKIIRFNADGRNHYLLYNAESGASIKRGEGHEQPDQQHIIYAIDDEHILTDRGYGKGLATKNSSWNGYNRHNVMSFYNYNKVVNTQLWIILGLISIDLPIVEYQNNGGATSPFLELIGFVSALNLGIIPAIKIANALSVKHKQSSGNDVTDQVFFNSDSYTHIKGKFKIEKQAGDLEPQERSYITRNVLFIKDTDSPYLIDFNSAEHSSGNNGSDKTYVVSYNFPKVIRSQNGTDAIDEQHSVAQNVNYPICREFELVTELTKSINNDTFEGALAPIRI